MNSRLPAGDLLRLFAAVPRTAQRLSLLSGQQAGGFDDTLAWNPAAVLEGEWRADLDLRARLVGFVQEQIGRGRLVVGYCSYELGHLLHGLPLRPKPGPRLPHYCWLAYENWLARSGDDFTIEARDARFVQQLEAAWQQARQPAPEARCYEPMHFCPALSPEQYRRSYARIHEHIVAGDIYQVNLTYQLRSSSALSGRQLFPFVARSNPVEHLAYLEGEGFSVQSASPERFVRVRGGQIETQPIKGTRQRGTRPDEDRAQLAELLASEKEAAELNMITDLLRNDLSEVCTPGSVQVVEHRVPRAGPRVWHTHSRIIGSLLRELDGFEAVLNLLPGGSVTGCPKRRALQLIDELEACARGVYTGVIGRMSPGGDCDFSIAIRTLIQQGSEVYLSVGGGIVYDSDPDRELEETLLKAQSFSELPAALPGPLDPALPRPLPQGIDSMARR